MARFGGFSRALAVGALGVWGLALGVGGAGGIAFADGPCADPSGQCPNGGQVTTQNPSAGNVDTSNPNAGNADVTNPTGGNVNTQNPSAGNANVTNPSAGNANVTNPNAGNANVTNPNAGNANVTNPSAGNANVTNPNATNADVTNPNATLPACQYVLGFQSLFQIIPYQVGVCSGDETHNPTNGDALQATKGGLLVWRKADNWTAFTDGYHTWLNGPNGIQERLNTQRFPWEGDARAFPAATNLFTPASAAAPPVPPTFAVSAFPSPVRAGAQVTVRGTGFAANGKGGLIYGVNIVNADGSVVDMRASGGALINSGPDGTFLATLTVPASAQQGGQKLCVSSGFIGAVCTPITIQGTYTPPTAPATPPATAAESSGGGCTIFCMDRIFAAGASRIF